MILCPKCKGKGGHYYGNLNENDLSGTLYALPEWISDSEPAWARWRLCPICKGAGLLKEEDFPLHKSDRNSKT